MKKRLVFYMVVAVGFMVSSVAFAGFDGRLARNSVIDELSGLLPTGDKNSDKRIKKGIVHLQKGLNDGLWENEFTLTKKGKKLFDEDKKAVKELMKVKALDVAESIGSLINIEGTLVRTATLMATETAKSGGCYDDGNNNHECTKALREIGKADKEMDKAQKELDHTKKDGTPDPKYDKAIDHYKKAWEYAQKAMKKLPEFVCEAAAVIGPDGGIIETGTGYSINIPAGILEEEIFISLSQFQNE